MELCYTPVTIWLSKKLPRIGWMRHAGEFSSWVVICSCLDLRINRVGYHLVEKFELEFASVIESWDTFSYERLSHCIHFIYTFEPFLAEDVI